MERGNYKRGYNETRIFLVIYEGVIIGTFSIRALDDQDNAFYRNVEGKYLYRIAILPRIQGLGLGVTMLNLIRENETLNRNNLYLDCWAGNKKLRNFYLESGFIYMGDYERVTIILVYINLINNYGIILKIKI